MRKTIVRGRGGRFESKVGQKRVRVVPWSVAAKRIKLGYKTSGMVWPAIRRLNSMIETKEQTRRDVGVNLAHNNVYVTVISPLATAQGTGDPMAAGTGDRIGDKINVKGIMVKGMVECALGRGKVFFRVMLLRGAKAETFSRATIFKGDSDNKMLDQVNTERFTIVAQKCFTCQTANPAPLTVGLTGVPATGTPAGPGTRTFKMWIPGKKFGKYGNVQYENGTSQVKFYDYKLVILAYDWYGTPQDSNNVGLLNEVYTKMYFKDA